MLSQQKTSFHIVLCTFNPGTKGAVGCSEFNRASLTKHVWIFFFTIQDVYLQYEDNVDVWLHDGTLFLLQQMALIHIN